MVIIDVVDTIRSRTPSGGFVKFATNRIVTWRLEIVELKKRFT